jgi:hypothetical protein
MRVRRKPYVCVDCDYADHFRFQETDDVEVSAGVWLRCLAHSHAQEQSGIVNLSWLRRTFAGKMFKRVEELVRVGLLRKRDDGDYEIYGYAPRNGTLRPNRSLTAEVHFAALRSPPRTPSSKGWTPSAPVAVTRDHHGDGTGSVTRDHHGDSTGAVTRDTLEHVRRDSSARTPSGRSHPDAVDDAESTQVWVHANAKEVLH